MARCQWQAELNFFDALYTSTLPAMWAALTLTNVVTHGKSSGSPGRAVHRGIRGEHQKSWSQRFIEKDKHLLMLTTSIHKMEFHKW